VRPYFAAEPAYSPQLGARLLAVVDRWYERLPLLRSYQRARSTRQTYYGLPSDASPFDVTVIGSVGRQGEVSAIHLNQLGVLGTRILAMTVTDELGWQPVVQNQDAQSRKDAAVARSVLDYERRAQHLDTVFASGAETAFLDGSSFLSIRWDERGGDVYESVPARSPDGRPAQPTDIHYGALRVKVHAWWRTMFDLYRHDTDHDWVILVDYVNKYDLAARYARGSDSLTQRILNLQREHHRIIISQQERGWLVGEDDTSLVPVYTLFHRKTESMPQGREVAFVDGSIVLKDSPLVYGRELPVVRMAPGEWRDTPHGHSPLVNLQAPQQAFNACVSSDLTNIANGAISRIWAPQGANLKRTVWEDGSEIIEGGELPPQALNTVGSHPATAQMAEFLSSQMAELSHLNPVSLGRQERAMSGALAALFDAKSREGISPFIKSYLNAVEQAGTQVLATYRACAKVPRSLEVIVGKDRGYTLKDFTGEQLGGVQRVTVEARNNMLTTTSGKMALLEALMAIPAFAQNPRAPEMILSVHMNGSIDPLVIAPETEDILIQQENEWMRDGQSPPVRWDDDDELHLSRHRLLSLNPADRLNEDVMRLLDEHEAQHRLQMGLKASGAMGPGLPPPAPVPAPGAPEEGPPSAPPQPPTNPAPLYAGPDAPSMPQMPINPATGQRAPTPQAA
jgi:hypothetical protein